MLRYLTPLLAALAVEATGTLRITKAAIDRLPPHLGISIDECGPDHVAVKIVACSCGKHEGGNL